VQTHMLMASALDTGLEQLTAPTSTTARPTPVVEQSPSYTNPMTLSDLRRAGFYQRPEGLFARGADATPLASATTRQVQRE
jgi:hypothetical protein